MHDHAALLPCSTPFVSVFFHFGTVGRSLNARIFKGARHDKCDPARFLRCQVYHLEPSVAVASQYMDHRVRHRVFRHILDWCGVADESRPSLAQFGSLTPADQIREVLKAALVARLGPEEGHRVFDNLD